MVVEILTIIGISLQAVTLYQAARARERRVVIFTLRKVKAKERIRYLSKIEPMLKELAFCKDVESIFDEFERHWKYWDSQYHEATDSNTIEKVWEPVRQAYRAHINLPLKNLLQTKKELAQDTINVNKNELPSNIDEVAPLCSNGYRDFINLLDKFISKFEELSTEVSQRCDKRIIERLIPELCKLINDITASANFVLRSFVTIMTYTFEKLMGGIK